MSANTISHLSSFFQSINFNFEHQDDRIVAGVSIADVQSRLLVSLASNGDIVNFELIGLVDIEEVRKSDHVGAFVQFLLARNWSTAAGALELDKDGEVRVVLELPMADALMTPRQLRLVLDIMLSHVKALLTDGVSILRTGTVSKEETDEGSEEESIGRAFMAFMQMSQSEDGRAQLRAIAIDSNAPNMLRALANRVLTTAAAPSEL